MPLPEWIPAREAAAYLGVSAATVGIWARENRIRSSITPGGQHRRYLRAEIIAIADGGKTGKRWNLLMTEEEAEYQRTAGNLIVWERWFHAQKTSWAKLRGEAV